MFQKKEKPQDKILEIITPQIGIFQIENISGERTERIQEDSAENWIS
jgi:hypothetical protein